MASPALLATYHIRGMTDVAGSPGATIATVKVEHYSDGTFWYTDANSVKRKMTTGNADLAQLLSECLTITLFGNK